MANILIIFDSQTGKTEELANKTQNILSELGNDVLIRRVSPVVSYSNRNEKVEESSISIINKKDIEWAQGYIVDFPIHTGTITAALKYFMDEYHMFAGQGLFLNKPVTAMAVGKLTHAGAETAIQQLLITLMQWGSIIVSTGIVYAEIIKNNGNPYGLSFILDSNNSYGDENKLKEVLTKHLHRFSSIVDANKGLITNSIHDTNKLPYTITDIFK